VFGYLHLPSYGEMISCWFICGCVHVSVSVAARRFCMIVVSRAHACFLIAGRREAESLAALEHELFALGHPLRGQRHGSACCHLRDLGGGATCKHRVDHIMHDSCSLLLNDISARRF
jgi:hypothetical protein